MLLTELPPEGVLSIPEGAETWTCETCGSSFDLSSEIGKQGWEHHQKLAELVLSRLVADLPTALALVGREFKVVYLPRYPNFPEDALGEISVKVVGVQVNPHPCSTELPQLLLDKEIPEVVGTGYGSVVRASRTPLFYSKVARDLESFGVVYFQPCGKESHFLENSIRERLAGGTP